MINDFQTDLAYSLGASTEQFWDQIYKKAFVNFSDRRVIDSTVPGYMNLQMRGVDSLVTLSNGITLSIDEKVRRKVYTDIALEMVSNDRTGAKGWMEKDLSINYLAYAFMPIERVYLFSWPMLKRAWEQYKSEWIRDYKIIKARNNGYYTHSVCVPIKVLRKAVNIATIIQL